MKVISPIENLVAFHEMELPRQRPLTVFCQATKPLVPMDKAERKERMRLALCLVPRAGELLNGRS